MSVMHAMIRKLTPGVEAARDARLARLAEVEAEPPILVPPAECEPCRRAREAHAAARAAADARSRERDVLRGEVLVTRPKAIRDFERWLLERFEAHRGQPAERKTERRASGTLIRAWTDAGWRARVTEALLEAQREARDVLPFVPSAALPGRIATLRAHVQAQLDIPEDERFTEMSARALGLLGTK